MRERERRTVMRQMENDESSEDSDVDHNTQERRRKAQVKKTEGDTSWQNQFESSEDDPEKCSDDEGDRKTSSNYNLTSVDGVDVDDDQESVEDDWLSQASGNPQLTEISGTEVGADVDEDDQESVEDDWLSHASGNPQLVEVCGTNEPGLTNTTPSPITKSTTPTITTTTPIPTELLLDGVVKSFKFGS
eukprot:TRINITY_DN3211_c0_g2_i6.p1 TRINITY_DN3211_c0_g2~~TRINITY_DN3211_c0_g2_i6.p1  ORF type:complete len:189 (-),score=52.71 TRINITY_DN3211_c0_g2_i6:120-686(-)